MAPIVDTHAQSLCANVAWRDWYNLERYGCFRSLIFEDREYTNVEELDSARRIARILQERGIRPADRVLVILPSSPELIAVLRAVWMIGAVVVPILPVSTKDEIAAVIAHSEPACIISLPPAAERIRVMLSAARSEAILLTCGEQQSDGFQNILTVLETATPVEWPANRSDTDLALLLYTSGTTAEPKAVMITHGNLSAALDSVEELNVDVPRGTMLHALPLSHSFGLLMLDVANAWGWTTVLLRQFEPGRVLQVLEHYQVQYLPAVPAMLVSMLMHPDHGRYNLSGLRRVISGGAALPENVRLAFERAYGCRVEQGYGLSETVAVATAYGDQEPYRIGSAGRATPRVQIRILDENGQPLSANETGEICIAGANVMAGYWRDPTATSEVFAAEWLRTGDMGYLDEDGYLYITDRKKDLIIKGGENVSPREIEEALYAHPAVAAAAVVGIADIKFGENICAVVQLKPGAEASDSELRGHVAQRMGKFKTPSRVVFWPDLPRNSTGKIWKRAIRTQLLAAVSASV